jgi:Gp157 protein
MIHFGSISSTAQADVSLCPIEENTMQVELRVQTDSADQQENRRNDTILEFAAITYRAIRDRLRAEDPQIDEQTLAVTVEGLTDLHEILTAIIRAALADQAMATGLEGRIAEMQARQDRLQDRAAKRRQIAKEVMVKLDLKKLTAPDFTASIRPGTPALMVIDEAAVPSIYWEAREPRLNRQGLVADLKQGAEITGVALSNPEPVLSVRTR